MVVLKSIEKFKMGKHGMCYIVNVHEMSLEERKAFDSLQEGDDIEIDNEKLKFKRSEGLRGCMCGKCMPPGHSYGVLAG